MGKQSLLPLKYAIKTTLKYKKNIMYRFDFWQGRETRKHHHTQHTLHWRQNGSRFCILANSVRELHCYFLRVSKELCMYVSSGTESNGPIYFEFRRQRNIILSIDVAAPLPAKKQSKMHFTAASLVMTDFRIASMTNHNKSQKLDLQLWSVSNFMCCFSLPFVFVKLKIFSPRLFDEF